MAPDRGPTTVLLADDHALVRAGLAALLGGVQNIEVIGEASDGRQAVELATGLRPDVVLMDLSMPVLDGIEATRQIVRSLPGTHVVMLTSYADRRRVTEAMEAGANGYLLKDCHTQDIIAAVASAAIGGAPIDPRVAHALRPPPKRSTSTPCDGTGRRTGRPGHLRMVWRHRG